MSEVALNRRTARTVCAAMQKGGVGKSTSIIQLARAAMLLGLKVLVVDLDPQGNSTDALTIEDLPDKSISVADPILPESALPPGAEPITMRDVIVTTIWDGVDLAPVTSSDALTRTEMLIQASEEGREHRLSEALDPVRADYDLVLVDNAPSLGLLLGNALAASDAVLVVMEADRWSEKGLVRLRKTIQRAQRYSNQNLGWAGVLISKWRNTADERAKLAEIAKHFPDAEVWASADDTSKAIPLRVKIKEEVNAGHGLDESKDARIRVVGETYEWAVKKIMSRKDTA